MNAPLFRPEAVHHQRERLWGNVILTQPLSMRLVTLVVLVLLVALIAYLTWGTYTRKERVRGYLVPEAGLVQVYPARPGTAVDILLEPGDVVKAGDTLARVRTDRTLRNGKGMNAELVHTLEEQAQLLKRRIDRARQRKEERRKHLEKKIGNARAKIEQLRAQLTLQKERVALTRARYSALETLHQEQLIPRVITRRAIKCCWMSARSAGNWNAHFCPSGLAFRVASLSWPPWTRKWRRPWISSGPSAPV
ncbi:MAG: hypothetical protein SVX28_04885 [Pseudomonadota bacterium]|nr:hypothetical protein [Pseudomonadota bacterium]